jgi:hypothetical protein
MMSVLPEFGVNRAKEVRGPAPSSSLSALARLELNRSAALNRRVGGRMGKAQIFIATKILQVGSGTGEKPAGARCACGEPSRKIGHVLSLS